MNIVKKMTLFASLTFSLAISQESIKPLQGYVSGDFHTHTWLSDGVNPESLVVKKAFTDFGLNWMANSEHGGAFNHNPNGGFWDTMSTFNKPYFKGVDAGSSGGHKNLWRWQSLAEYSYPIVNDLRDVYQGKKLLQGLEWNCPTHEHASVGFITDEPKAVANFEYLFDQNDLDTSRNAEFGIVLPSVKQNKTHKDAVTAAGWLQTNYKNTSYLLLNHPSRKLKYSIADIRDLSNAAPDVFIGLEGMPGHQRENYRGGYSSNLSSNTYKARTYGGVDYMCAKIGGLWDALISEGRHCWMFSNSDFHDTLGDFWPGEYQKNMTYVIDENQDKTLNNSELIKGLKSGNTWVMSGDLLNKFKFLVIHGVDTVTMGQTIEIPAGDPVQIVISGTQPRKNNNGNAPYYDHTDLISGPMRDLIISGMPEYNIDTVAGCGIEKTFFHGEELFDGEMFTIKYNIPSISSSKFFRVRMTNLARNTAGETDELGNPLNDDLMGTNNDAKAYMDLWLYSNPIWIKTFNIPSLTGIWNVTQNGAHSPYYGSFNLTQHTDGTVTGTAEMPDSLTKTSTGIVNGTLVGGNVVLNVTWQSGIIGIYNGTVTNNGLSIQGTGYDQAIPNIKENWIAQKTTSIPTVSGCWKIVQANMGTDTGFVTLTKDENGLISGQARFAGQGLQNGVVTGSVNGQILSFSINWGTPIGIGDYTAIIGLDGISLRHGKGVAHGQDPATGVSWTGERTLCP